MPYRGDARYEQLNRRLLVLEERLGWRNRLQTWLHRTERQLADERARLKQLAGALRQEQLDVIRLEKRSVGALLAEIVGSRERRLEKERAEALAAQLRHDEHAEIVRGLEREAARLRREIASLGDIRAEQRRVLKRKEKLLARDDRYANRVAGLCKEVARALVETKELEEALEAADAAYNVLLSLVEVLDGVTTTGTWGQRQRVEEAQALSNQAQTYLRRLEAELADVGVKFSTPYVRVERMPRMSDGFVHVGGRWGYQYEISDFADHLRRMRDRVADTARQIWELLVEVADRLDRSRERVSQIRGDYYELLRQVR